MNFTRMDVLLNGSLEEDVTLSPKVVGPKDNLEITIKTDVYPSTRITYAAAGESFTEKCFD